MATIDLIVLGMLKKEPLSAYDLQKLVEYRNISKWVKISTPSIYKKVIRLEEKGYISSHIENLDSMSRERQQECLDNIESSMEVLKKYLEENIALKKSKEDIPVTGMAVLRQQYTLAEAIEEWIASLKKEINS
mgnify:CR=1 FL=1